MNVSAWNEALSRLDPRLTAIAAVLLGAAFCFFLGRLSMRRRMREADRKSVV